MIAFRFRLSESSPLSLKDQICELVGDAVMQGRIHPGEHLPSCRELARQLGVSRSTAFAAYSRLVELGLIEASDRSGYTIALDIEPHASQQLSVSGAADPIALRFASDASLPSVLRKIDHPQDWNRYDYPFIYSQFDPRIFPLQEWRECVRQALNAERLPVWAGDADGSDSVYLVEQLRRRLLGYRGIYAGHDEILITAGAQNALFLLGLLFGGGGQAVAMEDPGYPEARNAFILTGNRLCAVEVDEDGLKVDEIPADCAMVYVTPSHQFPTTATMSLERRERLVERASVHGMIVVEDDYEAERNFLRDELPPVVSLDRSGCAVYVGSLSKALAPGLRLGYMVAHASIIREARAMRRAMMRNPAALLQDAMAHFISLGYQDAHLRRLHRKYRRRWEVMRGNLARHLPNLRIGPGQGGTSFWINGPETLDTDLLEERLRARSVLFDNGHAFYMDTARGRGKFRLGFGSIPQKSIEPGIEIIAEEINRLL